MRHQGFEPWIDIFHYPFPLYRLFFCPANRVWGHNDTISVSKSSPIMDDDFKAALSQAFINIGDTEEGKAVISIYSHQGYQPAQASDYDSERAAQKMIQELNSAA